ncbi:MAG: hypothetical protein HUK20_08025 [Fibrobacter sp.]|nr:hypothetical protein [Bacteroidales bacterium]MCF0224202.1 hypothetical protein [Fibrobacter sp.]
MLEFARAHTSEVIDAAFRQGNVEEIIRGALNLGLVDGDNVDGILDRAREAENWSLVAALLDFRAHSISFADRMTEEERLERELFGDLG